MSKNEDFQSFYEKYYNEVRYVTYRLTHDEVVAEDLTQDVFVKAYESFERLEENSNLRNWVLTIANNTACNYLRRKNLIKFISLEEDISFADKFVESEERGPEQMEIDAETRQILLNLIDGLPREQRVCVFLYYYEELSVKEIAKICECSEKTIYSRLSYSRKKLKEEIDKLENNGIKLRCTAALPFIPALFKAEKSGRKAVSGRFDVNNSTGGRSLCHGKNNNIEKVGVKMSRNKILAVIAAVVVVGSIGAVVGAFNKEGDDLTSTGTAETSPYDYNVDDFAEESMVQDDDESSSEGETKLKDAPAIDESELEHEVGYYNKEKTNEDSISFTLVGNYYETAIVTYKPANISAADFVYNNPDNDYFCELTDKNGVFTSINLDSYDTTGGYNKGNTYRINDGGLKPVGDSIIDSVSMTITAESLVNRDDEREEEYLKKNECSVDNPEIYNENGFYVVCQKIRENAIYTAYYFADARYFVKIELFGVDKDLVKTILNGFTVDYVEDCHETPEDIKTDKMFYQDNLAKILENDYNIYVRDLANIYNCEYDEVVIGQNDSLENIYIISNKDHCPQDTEFDGALIGIYNGDTEVYFERKSDYRGIYEFYNRGEEKLFTIEVSLSEAVTDNNEMLQIMRADILK